MLNLRQDVYRKLGLGKNEAKVYLALLQMGETTMAELVKRLELPRSTCYLLIESLGKKGLITQTKRGKRTYLAAASPEKLRSLVIEKEQETKEQRQFVESILPQLISLSHDKDRPKIQYFTGKEGVKAIFEDLLTSGEVKDYYIGSLEKVVDIVGERYMKNWMHRRVEAGIFSYGVRIKTEELPARAYRSSRKMMREIRFAPKDFESPQYIAIYGDNVAMISSKGEGFGLIIKSNDLAKTQKSLFDVLWKESEKVKK